jgi:DNA-binding YbaB/EbfC family protein
MQQAQRMQENLKRAQEEVAAMQATGQAGGNMVTVTINGRHEVKAVKIDPSLAGGDLEMIEDLVVAACNDANNRIAELTQQRMAEVTGGMNLPPGFKLPF